MTEEEFFPKDEVEIKEEVEREDVLTLQEANLIVSSQKHLPENTQSEEEDNPPNLETVKVECTTAKKRYKRPNSKVRSDKGTKKNPGRVFKCELCPYSCIKPKYIRNHARTHTGKKIRLCWVPSWILDFFRIFFFFL